MRLSAAGGLGALGRQEGWDYIGKAIEDPDSRLRNRAASLLGETRDPRALKPLMTLSQDSNPGVRKEVAKALEKIGGQRAVGILEGFLNDSEPLVKECAISILAEIGNETSNLSEMNGWEYTCLSAWSRPEKWRNKDF